MSFHLVAHVFLLRSGQTLLPRRRKTGFEDGNYGLPGGHIEEGESVRQAAARECREEFDIDIDQSDLQVIGLTYNSSREGEGIDIFLSAYRWKGIPRMVTECDELLWCPINNLPDTTIPFIRRAITNHLEAGQWFDEIGWEE